MAAKKKAVKAKVKKSDVIFVKAYVWVVNNDDGSASALLFNTAEEAEAYAELDSAPRFNDDVQRITLVVDPKTAKLCNVKKRTKQEIAEHREANAIG